jgi:hypothetical protein
LVDERLRLAVARCGNVCDSAQAVALVLNHPLRRGGQRKKGLG